MYYYNNYIKVLLVLYQRMSTTCTCTCTAVTANSKKKVRTRICECEVHFLCHVSRTFI
jgi:hypothetical protein